MGLVGWESGGASRIYRMTPNVVERVAIRIAGNPDAETYISYQPGPGIRLAQLVLPEWVYAWERADLRGPSFLLEYMMDQNPAMGRWFDQLLDRLIDEMDSRNLPAQGDSEGESR